MVNRNSGIGFALCRSQFQTLARCWPKRLVVLDATSGEHNIWRYSDVAVREYGDAVYHVASHAWQHGDFFLLAGFAGRR